MRLAELQISHTRQVNYGEEECKAAVMYALHLRPKAWGFAVLRKLIDLQFIRQHKTDLITAAAISTADADDPVIVLTKTCLKLQCI